MSSYDEAHFLLSAMDPLQASKLLGNATDLQEFIESNRLSLDESEIAELKSIFRA